MHRTTKRFLMRVRSITLAASLGVLWAWPLAGYVSPWGNLSPKRPSGTSLEPEPSALGETPELDTPRIESADPSDARPPPSQPPVPQSPVPNQAPQHTGKAHEDHDALPADRQRK